ncbi:MAG: lysozyme inhibitor LprI family protein [Verrucomicrobiota bacterium JB022]|nr:lysozyme inhibitor LprI family protein [Verrucomicrobiota bacterium JB022]
MSNRIVFILVCSSIGLLSLSLSAGILDDPRIQELEHELAEADTQTDMDLASKAVADYLDSRLRDLRARICAEIEPRMREQFRESERHWQAYRSAATRLSGLQYEGGSIRPLIHNEVFAQLTRVHIKELEAYERD